MKPCKELSDENVLTCTKAFYVLTPEKTVMYGNATPATRPSINSLTSRKPSCGLVMLGEMFEKNSSGTLKNCVITFNGLSPTERKSPAPNLLRGHCRLHQVSRKEE